MTGMIALKPLWSIWFDDGRSVDLYALGPLEASILAQAKSIEAGAGFKVSCVQSQDTGKTFLIKDGQAHPTD